MLHQLSAQDAQFLYIQTPENLTHVMAVYVYDPSTARGKTVRFKDIIEHVRSRLHISPVFKRKLYRLPFDIDHPYWVEDEHFDIEAHISHGRLPEPGDWRQFSIHVARHFSKPMDMNRPLWDMYVVEGLDRIPGYGKGSYAILTRVHHAAIDGSAATYFFTALSDMDAKGKPMIEVPPSDWDYGDVPSASEVMNRAISSNLTSPVKLTNAVLKLTPTLWDAARKNMSVDEDSNGLTVPDTRFNGAVSPHKMFDAVTFDLDELKAIRAKVDGVTINDVVLAICGGALRKYLMRHKELPKESLVAVAPVNARKRDSQDDSPGNKITAMSVKLWTNIANPLKRLEAIRKTTEQTKAAKSGLSARIMTDLTQHIPGATMAGVAKILTSERFAPKMSNVFISNIPGPQTPMYMNGAKLTHQYGMAPLGNGMGLFIATPSYNGTMSFTITTDRKIMPDIVFFRDCIQKAFEELRNVKIKNGGASTKKTAAKKPAKKKLTGKSARKPEQKLQMDKSK
ncbi:wax ester/triacylglycerol synthase family O-acyltransferase [Parasphingorhabdus sp. JC815]|uniref:WS/DGAT/MGAT family O-acyltransferase n=1 Tax=Parasphingorhabdus sp. JC815 TaxID=3232140 RepID=UPI003458E8F0